MKRLVYSCSGCASSGQMANRIAVNIDRRGLAEMSCIAGVGGAVRPMVEKARAAQEVISIDGCPLHCGRQCLLKAGIKKIKHYDLSKFGVIKSLHVDFNAEEADKVERMITEDLSRKEIGVYF